MPLDADVCDVQKEWDEALCYICIDHPHNVVLLLCTSHSKGCRSYICDNTQQVAGSSAATTVLAHHKEYLKSIKPHHNQLHW